MPNTVPFYEQLFLTTKLDTASSIQDSEEQLEEKDHSLKAEKANMCSLKAATAILDKYQKKFKCHHKEAANYLEYFIICLNKKNIELPLSNDDNFRQLFNQAITKIFGPDMSEAEITTEKNNPSQLVKNQSIALLVDQLIQDTPLSNRKSEFASVCFVLVKQLSLPVEKKTMEQLINGANFSSGFLYRHSDRNRRALELADVGTWESSKVHRKNRLSKT